MRKSSEKAMSRIRRKLTRFEKLIQCHLGHESLINKAVQARYDVEDEIERALNQLEVECTKPTTN